jgi:hypothetical protein
MLKTNLNTSGVHSKNSIYLIVQRWIDSKHKAATLHAQLIPIISGTTGV